MINKISYLYVVKHANFDNIYANFDKIVIPL